MAEDWRDTAAAVADPSAEPAELPRELLLEVFQHARECYPEECCGLFTGTESGGPLHVVRCANVQSQRVARGESNLDASRAFWIDEQELLHALRAAESAGEKLLCIYHSHVDAAAYLSHTDVAGALGPDGEPLYPGTAQLVVSVRDAAVEDAAWFEWDPGARSFRGRALR
jgi:[CysO sulfur-carrier protein]-S-L-cysteine hydrolase